jgi:hypothetical protein
MINEIITIEIRYILRVDQLQTKDGLWQIKKKKLQDAKKALCCNSNT